MTGNAYATGAGRKITAYDLHGRCFASAVGTEKSKHFALTDTKADIVERLDGAVGAADAVDFYQKFTTHSQTVSSGGYVRTLRIKSRRWHFVNGRRELGAYAAGAPTCCAGLQCTLFLIQENVCES